MGFEIKAGLDNDIQEATDLTSSDVAFASRVVDVLEGLSSTNNRLGDAAGKTTGTATGQVPLVGTGNKLPTALIDSATTGGSGNAGRFPLLDGSGLLSSTMIPSAVSATGGPKYVWTFGRFDTWGQQPSTTTTSVYSYTWRPQDRSGNAIAISSILVIATGGGGSGSYGPPSSDARKGGGGGGGGTAIRIYTGITGGTSYSVQVGRGGASRIYDADDGVHNGNTTTFNSVQALGGQKGEADGAGGNSPSRSIDQSGFGVYIVGGPGGNGLADKFGGGVGGSTYWGGGFPSAEGQGGDNGYHAAPGAGGGAAHGHNPSGVYVANQAGTRGNDGIVVVIGF